MQLVFILTAILALPFSSFAEYRDLAEAKADAKAQSGAEDRNAAALAYAAVYDLSQDDAEKAGAAYSAAVRFRALGQTAKAIEYFEKVIQLPREGSNRKGHSYRLLSDLYIQQRQYAKAKNACVEYLKNPAGPTAWQEGVKETLEGIEKLEGSTKGETKRSDLKYATAIHGSENHEIMRIGNILMAAQALKDLPQYRDKKLVNGETAQQRYDRWNRFFKHRWDEMAKHGLLAEAFADYGKYTLPEIYNMHEFGEDSLLRKKSEMLLHLIWTEWAVAQLNGVRGGGRNRLYQGDENRRAQGDTWRLMSLFLFDNGPWHTHWHPDPIIGCPRVLASAKYRVPELIKDIANDVAGRGEYSYTGKRLGKQKHMEFTDVPLWWSPWYNFDPIDTRMLAYDYCTPDYVMGCLMIDPTLPLVGSHDYLRVRDLQEGYAGLAAQNMYTAIVFSSDLNARVVPQCLPASETNLKTSLQVQSVQHENIMVIQRNQKSRNAKAMRVFFSTGMKERLVERDGWHLLREGDAFLAVKAFSRKNGKDACAHSWKDDCWLHPGDGDAPVVFVMGRKSKYADMDAFADYVMSSSTALEAQRFTIKAHDAHDIPLELSLFLDGSAIPQVNGEPIDFLPENVFDSPFFHSREGSGVVTIQKGGRSMILDFNKTTVTQVDNR